MRAALRFLVMFVAFAGCLVSCEALGIDLNNAKSHFINECDSVYYKYNPSLRTKDTTSVCLPDDHPALQIMRERAYRLGRIAWAPVDYFPSKYGKFSPEGNYTGIPYSSAKEKDKYVGQDVSFYTFLTAVYNPKSVLYTERIDQPPYHGMNCSAYYGTVCSLTVEYALGIDRPYTANQIGQLKNIKRVTRQNFDSCAPGDLVWRSGHIVLITDVVRGAGEKVDSVEVLESLDNTTTIKWYALDDFRNRWDTYDWILYRYTDLDKIEEDAFMVSWENPLDVKYRLEICCNRGDKAVYRDDEKVVINILSDAYQQLEILDSEGEIVRGSPISGVSDYPVEHLSPGLYRARLVDAEGNYSQYTFFEIVETSVSLRTQGKVYTVSFSSMNAEPEFIVFCSYYGDHCFFSTIDENDRKAGYKTIMCVGDTDDLYMKVHFKGTYGRITNEMMPL